MRLVWPYYNSKATAQEDKEMMEEAYYTVGVSLYLTFVHKELSYLVRWGMNL